MKKDERLLSEKELMDMLAQSQYDPNEIPDFSGEFCEGEKKEDTFGKWSVSLPGDMVFDNGRYSIKKERLTDKDLIRKMFEMLGINWNEFFRAYCQALTNAGHNEIHQFLPLAIRRRGSFGNWSVSSKGRLVYKKGRYSIEADSLNEADWILQLFGKAWIDWNDFIPAYCLALINAGYKEMRQSLSY